MILNILLIVTALIVGFLGYWDIKQRRKQQRNYILTEDNQTIVIPYRDPLYSTIRSIFTILILGRFRGKDVMKRGLDELKQDVNGSSQLHMIQSQFFTLPALVIWDPEVCRSVLFAKDTEMSKIKMGEVQERFVGESIILAQGEDWKHHKAALSPAFKWDHIQALLPEFISTSTELVEVWKAHCSKPIEIHRWIQKATLDAIGRGGFGYEFGALREQSEQTEELHVYEELIKDLSKPIHMMEKVDKLTGGLQRLRVLFDKFEKFMTHVITEKRKTIQLHRESHDSQWQPKDILDFLLSAQDSHELNDAQILKNLNTFFVAGHETTAGTLANTIHFLAENPQVQQRAREEVLSICGSDRFPTYQEIQQMEYIHNCVKETLRLVPAAPIVARSAQEDMKLGSVHIGSGTNVLLHIFAIHHDPELWGPDVEEYNPDRFLTENSKHRHRYAWFPFSLGPRQCIGNNFAMLEMRTFLAILLQKFDFAPDPKAPKFCEYMDIVVRPPPGCTLLITPR